MYLYLHIYIYANGPHTSNDNRLIFRSRLCEIGFQVIHAMGVCTRVQCALCTVCWGDGETKSIYVLESNEVFLVIQQNSLYSLHFMVLIGIISISVASLRILGLRS